MKTAMICLLTVISLNAQTSDVQVFVFGGNADSLSRKCSAISRMQGDKAIPSDASDISFCTGFISGVMDMHAMIAAQIKNSGPYCVPHEVTSYQLGRVFVRYADMHPEVLHRPAVLILSDSLSAAFPCS